MSKPSTLKPLPTGRSLADIENEMETNTRMISTTRAMNNNEAGFFITLRIKSILRKFKNNQMLNIIFHSYEQRNILFKLIFSNSSLCFTCFYELMK